MISGFLFAMLGLVAQDDLRALNSRIGELFSTLSIQVGNPTYFADGQVTGATAVYRLGPPFTAYVTSGRTPCESRSAVAEPPIDTGYGWRLQFHRIDVKAVQGARPNSPVVTTVLMRVTWKRMWERGQRVVDGLEGTTDLSLGPGATVVLDHLPAAASPGCGALGMGLEISVPKPSAATIYETDVWLVEQVRSAQETRQQQTLRMQESSKTQFFFDDISTNTPAYTSEAMRRRIQEAVARGSAPGPAGPAADVTLSVSGSVSVSAGENGKKRVRLEITRAELDKATGRRGSGGTTYEFEADEGQTVSFELPGSPSVPVSLVKLQLMIRAKTLKP
jgi:hypothetical protein